jgi:hypothetical protein
MNWIFGSSFYRIAPLYILISLTYRIGYGFLFFKDESFFVVEQIIIIIMVKITIIALLRAHLESLDPVKSNLLTLKIMTKLISIKLNGS